MSGMTVKIATGAAILYMVSARDGPVNWMNGTIASIAARSAAADAVAERNASQGELYC